MDGLRWLLLIFGILVIVGVYFYSRREKKESGDSIAQIERVEPTLDQPGLALDADSDAVVSEISGYRYLVV